jgi:hypothetical protein
VVRRLYGRSMEIINKGGFTASNDFVPHNLPGAVEARRAVWHFQQHMDIKTCGVLVLNICAGYPVFNAFNLESFRTFMIIGRITPFC